MTTTYAEAMEQLIAHVENIGAAANQLAVLHAERISILEQDVKILAHRIYLVTKYIEDNDPNIATQVKPPVYN